MVIIIEFCALDGELPDLLIRWDGLDQALKVLILLESHINKPKTLDDIGPLKEIYKSYYGLFE